MAFSSHSLSKPGSTFGSLSHLLEDFENYVTHLGGHIPHWQPKFDVRETFDSYELYGELPGITGKDITIEFTGPQNMLIQGTVERNYPPSVPLTDFQGGTDMAGSNNPEEGQASEPTSSDTKGDEGVSRDENRELKDKVASFSERFWLKERHIGEFSRSFSFPSYVKQENVKADFKDGILTIIVPKCSKMDAQRIVVN